MPEKPTYEELEQRVRDLEKEASDRTRFKKVLSESEEKFRSFAENSQDYIMRYDEQCRHLYQNAAGYRVSGFSEEEFIGKTHRELGFDEDLCNLWEEKITEVFETGKPAGAIFAWESIEGSVFLDLRLYPEFDQDGKVKTVLGVSRDITEFKQAEGKDKSTKNFYESILDGIINGVWVTDKDDVIYYSNRGMGIIAGIPPEQIVGVRVLIDFPENTLEFFRPLYQKAKKELKPSYYDAVPVVTPSGRPSYQSGWLIPRIKDGTFDGMICTVEDITARKQAEEEIRRSKILLESSIESPKDMIILSLDREYRYLYFNKTHAESMHHIFGTQPQIGDCIFDHMKGKDDIEKVKEHYDRVFAGEGHIAIERYCEGHLRYFYEIRYNPIYDEKNEIIGGISFAQDITERKQAEEALHKSEEKYRNLVEAVNAAIFALNSDGAFLFMNSIAAQQLGGKPKDFIGKHIWDVFPQAVAEQHLAGVREIVSSGRGRERESETILHNERRWYQTIGQPLRDDNGNIYGAMFVGTDTTERKQTQEALRESEERYRALTEVSPVGIFRTDAEGNPLYVNKRWCEMSGLTLEEAIKDGWVQALHHDDRDRVLKKWRSFIDEGRPYKVTCRFLHSNGEIIWVLGEAIAERNEKGAIVGYVGTITDITKHKKAEEALRESESKLRQAQKMESIGTLAGGIAHEFNNILGIIIGNTELAIDDVPEWNPAKECLKEIRKASMRAKDVVRHILSFARKTPAQRKPIQISTIIRDSLKLMRASIPTTIEIRQNIACESEMILADPTEINQILMNLCNNAVHALSEETAVLEISLESINLDKDSVSQYENLNTGDFVKLTVKDNGQGIDPKIMDQIFDPYFTTKDIGEGTGMGLAVAYGIVKKHDGAIKASSEFGIGTVVEVLFPLIEEVVEHEVEKEPQVLPRGTERILFVDDEISLVKMAQQMLKRFGYEVITKTNPKEALALFKTEADQFDLVITDMAMPQMAGDRFAQELMKVRKDIPVILCTGHSARIDEDKAKELGLAAYVMKPLVTRDFTNTVRKVLDAAKGP